MSARSAWSCGLSAKVNRPISDDPDPQPEERRPGQQEDDEAERPAEVDPDDERLAPDPVRQPAGDERHRHARRR